MIWTRAPRGRLRRRPAGRWAGGRRNQPEPRLEILEDRLAPAVITWTGAGDGTSWADPANWLREGVEAVPQTGDDVSIPDVAATSTVVLSGGAYDIYSLDSDEAFRLAGGTLTVADVVQVNNTFTISGGTLADATIVPGSGGQGVSFTSTPNNRLRNVTSDADLDLTASHATARIEDGLTLHGTATLRSFTTSSSSGIRGARLIFEPSAAGQLLDGTGAVAFDIEHAGGTIRREAQLYVEGDTELTIGPGITVRGAWGRIGGAFGADGADTIVNHGTITSDQSGTLTVQPDRFENRGTVEARGPSNSSGVELASPEWTSTGTIRADGAGATGSPQVILGGTFTLPAGHAFDLRGGGRVRHVGTLQNAGNAVTIDATDGTYTLDGGAILGGVITGPPASALGFSGDNLLRGVTADIDLDLVGSRSTARVEGGLTLHGTATLRGYRTRTTGSPYFGAQLIFEPSASGDQFLDGSGDVVFEIEVQSLGSTDLEYRPAHLAIEGDTELTIGPGITLRGERGRIGGHFQAAGSDAIVSLGTIASDRPGTLIVQPDRFENRGTVEARGPAGGLGVELASPEWTSTGTIRADGTDSVSSEVILGGTFTLSAGHAFDLRGGGRVRHVGTLQNAGNAVTIDATDGTYTLDGGAILGGVITGPPASALGFTSAPNLLRGVTLDVGMDLTASHATVHIEEGLTLHGTATLRGYRTNLPFGGARLIFGPSSSGEQLLEGTGAVAFEFEARTSGLSPIENRPAHLAIEGDTTLTIGPGITLRGTRGLIGGHADIEGTDTLVSRGTIAAERGSLQLLTIQSDIFNNEGTLELADRTLVSVTSGTFTQRAGSTTLDSLASLTASAPFTITGGTLAGVGTVIADVVNGSRVAPGVGGVGILTINGSYTQTAAGVLDIEVNGLVAGTDHDQLRVIGTVALDGGLGLTSPFSPVLGDSFVLIDNDDVDAVAGLFAGQPEGSYLILDGRAFQISYQAGTGGNDVVLTHVNTAPTLDPIADQAVDEGALLSLVASATDPEGDPLTFSLDPGAPAGAHIDPDSGEFTWIPTEDQGPGHYQITVRVTDGRDPNLSDTETFAVTVIEVNQAPVLDFIPDQSIDERHLLRFTASATDPEGGELTYSLADAPAGAAIDPNTGIFSWRPSEAQGPGSFQVTIIATDDGIPTLSDQQVVTITVNEVNEAPVLAAIGDRSIDEGSTLNFTASATDPDLPANGLTYSLEGAPAGAAIDPVSGEFSWTPTAAQAPGSYTFIVRVTDDGSPRLSDSEQITVTVRNVNTAPSLLAIADQQINEGEALVVSGAFADPDDDSWTATVDYGDGSGLQPLSLDPDKTFVLDHIYADDGSYTVMVTVDDGAGAGQASFVVTVLNLPPTAGADEAVTDEDVPVVIDVLANDSDPAGANDPISVVSATDGAHGRVAINPNGTVTYEPDPGFAGTDRFLYTIDDGDGGIATGVVDVTVNNLVDVSGRVFDDLNNDGRFDPLDGELGIGGVIVQLYDEDGGLLLAEAVTAPDGTYFLDVNLRQGTYRLVQVQPEGLLDSDETAGNLGGVVDNDRDSNTIAGIVVGPPGTTADAVDYLFAEIRPSSIMGLVWLDLDDDGLVDIGERGIAGVTIELEGTDDRGAAVHSDVQTDEDGVYGFFGLRPGTYTIRQVQPPGYLDGSDSLGTVDGTATGSAAVDDEFSAVVLPAPGSVGEDYNFGERPPAEGQVEAGQTATLGFWQNKNGQALIASLNGGPDSTRLGDWLAANFPNMYGADAGKNDLTGRTNAEVAAFYKDLFRRNKSTASGGGSPKLDAQILAVALAAYVTSEALAGTVAAEYGFLVTGAGVGARSFNVGDNGAAFGVADHDDLSILALLQAVDERATAGLLYDMDGDGDADDDLESRLRTMANDVFSAINEAGD